MQESPLFRSLIERGRAEGEARNRAETLIQILAYRMGYVDDAVREQVWAHAKAQDGWDNLRFWNQEALLITDAEGARRLADKIKGAPPLKAPATT